MAVSPAAAMSLPRALGASPRLREAFAGVTSSQLKKVSNRHPCAFDLEQLALVDVADFNFFDFVFDSTRRSIQLP